MTEYFIPPPLALAISDEECELPNLSAHKLPFEKEAKANHRCISEENSPPLRRFAALQYYYEFASRIFSVMNARHGGG